MKVNILAFAAHPDDVELSAAGTLIKHVAMGYSAGIIDLTRGELGTRGTAEDRDNEAAAAAEYLKLSARENLQLADGFFRNTKEAQIKVIEAIRKYQPDIVLCNAISDRHPDHGKGSELVSQSCFLAGLQKVDTDQPAWRPKSVYHYIQDRYHSPDFVIDITEQIDQKIEAVMRFKSQFYNPESKEAETPISSKAFIDFLKARAREMGRQSGYEFGEGFQAERYIGVKDLFDLQ